MATYYGLLCRTCDESSYPWVRRFPEQVAELVRCYPVIRDVVALSRRDDLPWWLDCDVRYTGMEGDPPHLYLQQHYGHDLVVYDEYGRQHPEIALLDSNHAID